MKCYRHLQSFRKIVSCSRPDLKSSSLSCLNASFSKADADMKKCWRMCFKISMDHFRILTWVLWIFPCKHCLNGSTMNVLHVLWKVHLPAHLGSGLSGNSENFSEQLSDWRWLKQSINLSFCNRSHFNLQITLYSNVVLNLYCHVFYFYWSIAKPNSLNSLRTFSHRRTGNGPFSWMYGHFFSGSALALSLWKVHLLFSFTEESFPWILNTRGQ